MMWQAFKRSLHKHAHASLSTWTSQTILRLPVIFTCLSHDCQVTLTCLRPHRRSSIQFNPEFLSTIATVSKLISNMEAVKERVEGMWHARGEKLEATYKQQTFEKEANMVKAGSQYDAGPARDAKPHVTTLK